MANESGTVIIIPARYGSTRFEGKPLAVVAGRTILERTYAIARAVRGTREVVIATDDERIANAAAGFGAKTVITRGKLATGSDRVAAAARELSPAPRNVINLQGDALLTPPWVVEALVEALTDFDGIVTAIVRLGPDQYEQLREAKRTAYASGTTVVIDHQQFALYFSKHLLPYVRNPNEGLPAVYRHIGVYGYSSAALTRFAQLPVSPLEQAEGLEQLRALENGMQIRTVQVDYRGRTHWSIDHPDDVAVAEAIIRNEGELCQL